MNNSVFLKDHGKYQEPQKHEDSAKQREICQSCDEIKLEK